MSNTLDCIMLVDDDKDHNFLHQIVIRHTGIAQQVVAMQSVEAALDYLMLNKQNPLRLPDLILLDINMPAQDGWDFLDQFGTLKAELQKLPVTVMLTTSDNPDDKAKALTYPVVSDYKSKPLNEEILADIKQRFF